MIIWLDLEEPIRIPLTQSQKEQPRITTRQAAIPAQRRHWILTTFLLRRLSASATSSSGSRVRAS